VDRAQISTRLVELLGLTRPPVALAFADAQPPGASRPASAAPSACSFWRRAEEKVFYASAEDHFNCLLGSMVMGFELPAEAGQELGGLVEFMCGEGYIGKDEPAGIPTVQRKSAGILYGPLAELPAEPDLIVMWLIPQQAMIFNEAVRGSDWAGELMQVSGRPGCAALPRALQGHKPAESLGCTGMRTFTGIANDELLAVVPGDQGAEVVAALERTASANATMSAFYQQQLAKLG
jgi:uncharacterized protein (DUF169 family)